MELEMKRKYRKIKKPMNHNLELKIKNGKLRIKD